MNKLDLETIIIITNHHKKKSGVQKTYVCKLDTMERAGSGGGGGLILIKKKRGRDMEVIHMIDKVT